MIHTIRTVAVGDQESKIDSPIILYRGDREVEVEFTINGSKFTFTNGGNVIKSTNATHGQLVVNTPTGENMFSEVTECHDGKVVFVITKEMIDELIEVGFYSFQIRLFDESQVSRVTIPPVLKGIDIRNPIAAEDETNVVDIALVDYSVIVKDEFEDLSTFLPDGNYNKTEWESKDIISGAKLNKIEDALYNINSNMEATDLALLNRVENIDKNVYREIDKLGNELESEVEELERSLNTNIEQFKIDTNVAMTAHKNEVSGELESVNSQLAHFTKYDVVTGLGCDNKGLIEIGDIIQSFLDSTSDSKINLYFPPGTYKWNITVSTNKTLFIGGERGNVIINNSGDLACLKHNGDCTINGLTFNTSSSNRSEFTVYSVNGGEFLCYDTIFSCTNGKINGLHVENTVISHIDRCKFNHSQISLRTWDCKITNTWVWALWRPYGIGIHGGSGNITINNVDIVPPFRTNSGDLNSDVLLDGIKAGIWINSENGNTTNNVIMENIYLDGNQELNTGIGLLCEQVFGITLSSFRANKMSDYPIVIDSCYNVIVSKGVFYENNKLDLEKNEILIRKTKDSKHDNITITSNQFINYTGTKTKPVPAIKVEDNANDKVSIRYNNISQGSQGETYGNIEIVTPTMSDLNTNISTRYAYKLSGSFVIPSGRTGVSLTLPKFMAIEPTQKNFRFWVDNGFLPTLRVQKNTKNNVWIGVQTAPSSNITVYYEVNI